MSDPNSIPDNATHGSPPPVPSAIRLPRLAAILVSGADARTYLQGQLTANLDALDSNRAQLACCNSPQGRVQAVFWTVARDDGFALVLPAALVENTVLRLRKYVLRAKAKIEAAPHLQVAVAPRTALPAELQLASGAHRELDGVSYFSLPGLSDAGGDDVLLLGAFSARVDAAGEHRWHVAHIRAGLPQVYPETHEAFVAQMLNIDLLGGIDFEKGCYTGQEIIARAHFRGAVKRRMFLFQSAGEAPAPGTRVLSGEQHAGEVVDAAATENGSVILAVISLARLDSALHAEGQTSPLSRLPLPYAVE